MRKKSSNPIEYRVSPSIIKREWKSKFEYNEDNNLPSKKVIEDIVIFLEGLISKNHIAEKKDVITIIDYFRAVFVYHNKYEKFPEDIEVCLMYRDLLLFYLKIKSINKSKFDKS